VNRVVRLTPDEFEERPVATIAPTGAWRGASGCHTLSCWGQRTLIDAHWRVVCLPAVRTELRARLRRGRIPR
jgi:hypothetical protein